MKTIVTLLILFVNTLLINAQTINPSYDSTLAKSFGADDYGMKKYIFVILKTGTREIDDKKIIDSLFAGHLNNINRLVELGKLVVAGPLGKNDKAYRGIFILNINTFDEAEELLQTDPAIKEKLLATEIYQWYGAAALSEYFKVQEKIGKFKF